MRNSIPWHQLDWELEDSELVKDEDQTQPINTVDLNELIFKSMLPLSKNQQTLVGIIRVCDEDDGYHD